MLYFRRGRRVERGEIWRERERLMEKSWKDNGGKREREGIGGEELERGEERMKKR